MEKPGEVLAVESDAAFGAGEVLVHAQEGAEHAGRLVLGMGAEVGERGAVQVLDPSGDLGGREVGQAGFPDRGPRAAPARGGAGAAEVGKVTVARGCVMRTGRAG